MARRLHRRRPMRILVPLLAALLAAAPALAAREPEDPLAVQVLLDRTGFSPGAADGKWGKTSVQALAAFQEAHSLPATGAVDAATWENLTAAAGTDRHLAIYPVPLPRIETAALTWELLAERFHTTPALLRALNPGAGLVPGTELQVPNVRLAAGAGLRRTNVRNVVVVLARKRATLTVENGSDVLFFAPLQGGAKGSRPPPGEGKIASLDETGPLCVERDAASGCVRLNPWDARRVAELVKRGTRVRVEP